MNSLKIALISFFVLLNSHVAKAGTEDGKELHQESCTSCHSSELYKPDTRKVKNLPALDKQVRMCKNNLGLTWFDDEVSDVVDYLSVKHYRF